MPDCCLNVIAEREFDLKAFMKPLGHQELSPFYSMESNQKYKNNFTMSTKNLTLQNKTNNILPFTILKPFILSL